MRRGARRDGNHAALTAAFVALGCSVADLSAAGISGWPDVVVGVAGVNALVEFKDPTTRYGRAGLNDNQQAFSREWRGGKLYVVSTTDEVAALVRNLKAQAWGNSDAP